jgi:hypothetical protein
MLSDTSIFVSRAVVNKYDYVSSEGHVKLKCNSTHQNNVVPTSFTEDLKYQI